MNIFWSLDPFESKDLFKKGASLIHKIKSSQDKLYAGYVAAPTENKLSTAFDVPAGERFSIYPKTIIEKYLKQINVKAQQVEVIPSFHYSLTSSVKSLLEVVNKKHIDLIVVASKGQKGLPRLVLGSFAETLIFLSEIDLLLYRLNTQMRWRQPGKLLYAHDFTQKGDKGFLRVLQYAKKWNSQLIVFHQPEPAYSIEFEGQDKSVKLLRKKIDSKANKIDSELRRHKVKGNVVLKQSWIAPSESIMKIAAKENVDLIVMTSQCGKLLAAIGGSITRRVIRTTTLPVLVVKV